MKSFINCLWPLNLLFVLMACSSAPPKDLSPAPPSTPSALASANSAHAIELIDISNPEFNVRLNRSTAKANFFNLANHYETQMNKFFCGPVTSVVVLNSLRLSNPQISKPTDPTAADPQAKKYYPNKDFVPSFEKYTQHNFFNPQTEKVKPLLQILGKPAKKGAEPDPGYSVRQLAETLKTYGLEIKLQIVAKDADEKLISDELIRTLAIPGTYVISNYFRPALGQKGGGHISPLGAYDSVSDSFLIMDVNPSAASWVWAKRTDLIAAMRTLDETENRGYILVSEKK